jgi:hypothetical protein
VLVQGTENFEGITRITTRDGWGWQGSNLRLNRSWAHQPRHDRWRRIGRSARLLMSNQRVSDRCRPSGDADSAGTEDLYDPAGDSPWPPGSGRGNRGLRSGWIPATRGLPSVPVDTYQLYDGTDELGIIGTVAPGLFAQEGRSWRMVYETQSAKMGMARS